MEYLKAGIGDAWAGQRRAKDSLADLRNDNVRVSETNLGFAPPMGSIEAIEVDYNMFWVLAYLNAGTGKPWDGQRSAKGVPLSS